MNARRPRFGRGVKLRFDSVRETWVLLAPERLFLPDDHAIEILKLIDGKHSFETITSVLAKRFNAPLETVASDVSAMLENLASKNVVRL